MSLLVLVSGWSFPGWSRRRPHNPLDDKHWGGVSAEYNKGVVCRLSDLFYTITRPG